MEHHERCPNCGRELTEDEIYCYFCEMDMSKTRPTKHTKRVFEHARKS